MYIRAKTHTCMFMCTYNITQTAGTNVSVVAYPNLAAPAPKCNRVRGAKNNFNVIVKGKGAPLAHMPFQYLAPYPLPTCFLSSHASSWCVMLTINSFSAKTSILHT